MRQNCVTKRRSTIHVEKANKRIKNYEILSHVPSQYRHLATKLFQFCGRLVYLQASLLKEITDKYEIGKRVRNVLINMINTVKDI